MQASQANFQHERQCEQGLAMKPCLDVQKAQDDSGDGVGILAEASAEHGQAIQGREQVVHLPQLLILQCCKDPGLQAPGQVSCSKAVTVASLSSDRHGTQGDLLKKQTQCAK